MAQQLSRKQIARYAADSLLKGGTSSKQLAKQLAAYLVESNRAKEIELLVKDIAHELSLRGHVSADVTSARELSGDLKKQIERLVRDFTDARTADVDYQIDPSLLGGLIIRTPERELDVSIRGKLQKLKA